MLHPSIKYFRNNRPSFLSISGVLLIPLLGLLRSQTRRLQSLHICIKYIGFAFQVVLRSSVNGAPEMLLWKVIETPVLLSSSYVKACMSASSTRTSCNVIKENTVLINKLVPSPRQRWQLSLAGNFYVNCHSNLQKSMNSGPIKVV